LTVGGGHTGGRGAAGVRFDVNMNEVGRREKKGGGVF